MQIIHVVAALIIDKGKFLITRRPLSSKHGSGKWEFPGGKINSNETPSQALVREIEEELSVKIKVLEEYSKDTFSKDGVKLEITFYKCSIMSGKIKNLQVMDHRWVSKPYLLDDFDIIDSDLKIAKRLSDELKLLFP